MGAITPHVISRDRGPPMPDHATRRPATLLAAGVAPVFNRCPRVWCGTGSQARCGGSPAHSPLRRSLPPIPRPLTVLPFASAQDAISMSLMRNVITMAPRRPPSPSALFYGRFYRLPFRATLCHLAKRENNTFPNKAKKHCRFKNVSHNQSRGMAGATADTGWKPVPRVAFPVTNRYIGSRTGPRHYHQGRRLPARLGDSPLRVLG